MQWPTAATNHTWPGSGWGAARAPFARLACGLAVLVVAATTMWSTSPAPLASPTPPRVPASLVGTWERRDAYLIVGASGSARFRWRTDWCGAGTPDPCDRVIGDNLAVGAHAEIGFSGPEREHASTSVAGRIFSVIPAGLFVVGPVSIVRLGSDLIELRQDPRRVELCRPPRELDSCDVLPSNQPNDR